jgi:hypothetical protein
MIDYFYSTVRLDANNTSLCCICIVITDAEDTNKANIKHAFSLVVSWMRLKLNLLN